MQNLEDRVLKTSFGHELGRLVGMGFFPSGFTPAEIALIDFSDDIAKRVHNGESRQMGGPYDEHVKDMTIIYSQISRAVSAEYGISMKPTPRDVISIILHDVVEDHPTINALRKELRAIKSNGAGNGNNNASAFVVSQIKAQREGIVSKLYKDLIGFSGSQDFVRLLNGQEGNLALNISSSMGIVDWLTRHTEDSEYYQSVFHLCRMHSREEYKRGARGGPFQKYAMGALGMLEGGLEPTDYFAARVFLKLLDRIALSRERTPRFDKEDVAELERGFQQNEWLKQMYGGVKFTAEEMPSLYVMKLLYRNYVVLHNANLALSSYGGKIASEKGKNPSADAAYAYLFGIENARQELLRENVMMIAELKTVYESRIGGERALQIRNGMDKEEKDNPLQYEAITGKGPISRGARYAPVPRGELRKMDAGEMEENYRDVLGFEKLQQRFLDPVRNMVDFSRGYFSLFTINGLTDKLEAVSGK